jgi:hypothetical protein
MRLGILFLLEFKFLDEFCLSMYESPIQKRYSSERDFLQLTILVINLYAGLPEILV